MSQTEVRVDTVDKQVSAGYADERTGAQLVESQSVSRTPVGAQLSNMSVSTGAVMKVGTIQILYDMFVTGVSVLPLTLANTLTFWVQLGTFNIGSSQYPIVMTGAAYNRTFQEPHLPLIHAGESMTVFASDNSGQYITVVVEGYKVGLYD